MNVSRKFERQGPLYLPLYGVDTPLKRYEREQAFRRRHPRHRAGASLLQVCQVANQTGISVTATFGSNIGVNHLVVGIVYWSIGTSLATTGGITDSNGSSYTIETTQSPSGTTYSTAAFFACPTGASAGKNLVATFSPGAASFVYIVAAEYSGINTTTPLDQTAQTTGTASTVDSGATSNTTNANDLLVGLFGTNNGATSWTPGTSYTVEESNLGLMLEDQTVSSTGAYHATCTNNAGSDHWTACVFAFMIAGAAAATPNLRMLMGVGR
jgi:hypothetical protein